MEKIIFQEDIHFSHFLRSSIASSPWTSLRKTEVQRFIYKEKGKAWNRGKQTKMPVTVTEGLATTAKG